MTLVDDPEWTVHKNIKMDDASLSTAQADAIDEIEDARAWAEIMNWECSKDENDGIKPKTGQETMAKGKSPVHNVF